MKDIYSEITNRIIAQLEQGTAPWVKPWKAGTSGLPFNYLTKKAYRGINVPLLYMSGFSNSAWLTYKQAAQLGGYVRKGEKGTPIVFFTMLERDSKESPGKKTRFPMIRYYTVFNVSQCDGLNIPVPTVIDAPVSDDNAEAEAMLSHAQIHHGQDKAFYAPALDFIGLPDASAFKTKADYYATALHELTHWTGHATRCNREYGKKFGDDAYAREELVAEMGAAFLCAMTGVEGKLQHAEYIASWLKILREDKRAVFTAASAAQKAADMFAAVEVEDEEAEAA